jgi:hypothetical protein
MADLTNTYVADNYNKFVISQSDAGREIVISASKSNMTDADLRAVATQLTVAGGANADAFTIAAFGTATGVAFVSGETDVAYFRIQGTGTPDLSEVSGVTLAKIAEFVPAK